MLAAAIGKRCEETLQFNGKILMVKPLTIWSTETMTDFRPVPPDITTAQALDLLHKSSELVADGKLATRQAQNNPRSSIHRDVAQIVGRLWRNPCLAGESTQAARSAGSFGGSPLLQQGDQKCLEMGFSPGAKRSKL